VIVALSGGQKLGLLVVAAIFIGFALASSFLFPRSNPDFPGPRLRLFLAVSIGLMIAMLAAMAVFAREEEEEGGHAAEPAAQAEETTPGETQAGEGAAAEGDAAAGKQVFASAGCGGCHTLADAGSSGNVGPNLDEAQPDHALVVDRVTNGKGPMPSFKDQLSAEDIQNVAAYVSEAAGGS
jgi:mono/diheme cytochrome c family protein